MESRSLGTELNLFGSLQWGHEAATEMSIGDIGKNARGENRGIRVERETVAA